MKKTSIVCTIGPASQDVNTLVALANAGMNVARVNMSHSTHELHQIEIDNIIKARNKVKKPIAIMLDTKGPEIRIRTFKGGEANLQKGKTFTLTTNEIEGNENIVTLAYKDLVKEVKPGWTIYANNGMLSLKIKEVTETDIICKVIFGGKLTDRKGLNIPHVVPNGPFVSEVDKYDILFGIKNKVDYVSASFVSCKENLIELREFLDANGGQDIKIISKIENPDGVKRLAEIIERSDGIMVARGDLGVEIPLEKVPIIQKQMIKACNEAGKPVIVATEMLESMTSSRRPTRAEVSDVANSVYDLATATMLSGETAIGRNPLEVVKTMSKIILESERNIDYDGRFDRRFAKEKKPSISSTIARTACTDALQLNAKLIVVYTMTGSTVNKIAGYHVGTPILALTSNKRLYNALAMSWNTTTITVPALNSEEAMVNEASRITKELGLVKSGDVIIVVTGTPKVTGKTNMMRIVQIQ